MVMIGLSEMKVWNICLCLSINENIVLERLQFDIVLQNVADEQVLQGNDCKLSLLPILFTSLPHHLANEGQCPLGVLLDQKG